MTSSFGTYRGRKMYLMHIASNAEDKHALPFICHMKNPVAAHYNEFLSRKTKDGYESRHLLLLCEGEDKVWIRVPGSRRMRPQNHAIVHILDNFKQICRLRLALNRIRQRRRSSIIKEELIMRAYHPDRIERWLNMGYDLDVICDL
jgi:hypothetical protein